MQIKQFSGATIDDVLTKVREELGEDAVILQTKRVVTGGIGGFFGREGVEVTAAEGMPAGEGERANREAAASVAAPPALSATTAGIEDEAGADADAGAGDEFVPTPFGRHLDTRLAAAEEVEAMAPAAVAPASPAAAYARGSAATAAPFAPGDRERTQAIIEAARAAVREAHDQAIADPEPLGLEGPADPAEAVTPVRTEPAGPSGRTASGRSSGTLDGVRAELVRAGVDPRYLDPFLDGFARSAAPFLEPRASVRDAMREYLAARLPVTRDWKARPAGHAIAFVGQSGVGKTSAAAGLAGRHRAAGLTVALVAAGPGPHDALEGHARRMDIQLFRAADATTLSRLRATLVDRDLVVVDTAGRSHQQLAEMEDLAALLGPAKIDEVTLVLPLATPLADLGDVQRRFRMVGVNRLALSKLDETRHLGNLVNVPLRMGKPLSFLSDGTSVPDALAPADARRVAEMILP